MPYACTPCQDGGLIRFQKRTLLGKRTYLAVEDWEKADGLSSIWRCLRDLIADGMAEQRDGGVFLPSRTLLAQSDAFLNRLGVPALAGLSLGISMRGRIDSSDSILQLEWLDSSSRVISPDFLGPFIRLGGDWGRLSARLFILHEAVRAFNASCGQSFEDRLPSWTEVQTQLKEQLGHEVRAGQHLQSLQIYQAGAMTLDVRETPHGPDFLPVLLPKGASAVARGVDDGSDTSELDDDGQPYLHADGEEGDSTLPVLPPMLASEFERRFNAGGAVPPALVLKSGAYLLVDPPLQRALDVVQRARHLPAEDRRTFLKNPRTVLAQALGDDGDALAEVVFVETAQYSERIQGLGIWEKPQLPWLSKRTSQWLPERFPVTIGDRTIETTAEGLEDLGEKCDEAERVGETEVEFQGERYPALEVRKTLTDILGGPETSNSTDENIEAPENAAAEEPDKNVLLIQENLEDVDYTAAFLRRERYAPAEFPKSMINGTVPKAHQLAGVAWLTRAWQDGWPGVLLADDMGVGKTFQALAFLAWIRLNQARARNPNRSLVGPLLIVAPTALLNNWQKESEVHLVEGALGECCAVYGAGLKALKRKSTDVIKPEDLLDVDRMRRADWVLTTYETLANYHRSFARVAFSVVVFDEIQKIKAPDSINRHAAATVNADFVLGMTGTPIENRIEDLWCIMDRIAPGYLKDLKTFAKTYGQEDEEALTALKAQLDAPSGDVAPVLLRRMKEQISSDLPRKTIIPYRVPMPPEQANLYGEVVDAAKGGVASRKSMLKTLHELRSISLHPQKPAAGDLYEATDRLAWIGASARLTKTFEILRTIRESGQKALIFLEDRAMQDALAVAISGQFAMTRRPTVINGAMDGDKRQHHVDAFQQAAKGFDVLILSPKAAGIGLTITAANHVIHLSRWWNPAVEDQCNDRTYRIGQTRDVTVHLPLAVHPRYGDGSFDVRLNQLLDNKRSLSRHMLAPPVTEGDADRLYEDVIGSVGGDA